MGLGPRLLVVALTLAAPAAARASSGFRFAHAHGTGTAACPGAEQVMAAVAAQLGRSPWDPWARRIVNVRIERAGRALEAAIELRDGDRVLGVRRIRSEQGDCAELSRAAVLAISMAVDQLSPAPPRSPPVPPPVRPRVSASVGGLLAIGSAPGLAGGLTLGVRARWRAFSIGLEARGDPPARAARAGWTAGMALLSGAIAPCVHWRSLLGCGQLAIGAVWVSGHEAWDDEVTLPHLAAGLRLGTEVPISTSLSLRWHADLLVPLLPIAIDDADSGERLWTAPAVGGALGLAVVGSWP